MIERVSGNDLSAAQMDQAAAHAPGRRSPLKLSKVHWVKPDLVVEVTYLTWTEDNLLRQVS